MFNAIASIIKVVNWALKGNKAVFKFGCSGYQEVELFTPELYKMRL